jgi:hypothetical protein
MKKLLWPWGVALFAIFYAVNSPSDAANLVQSTVGMLGNVGDGLSNFVNNVATI